MRYPSSPYSGVSRPAPLLLALAGLLILQSCGGDDLPCNGPFCQSPPEQAEAASLSPGQNNGQTGAPGRELAESIDVLVTDNKNRPVPGVTVNFSVSSGGGTISSATAESDVDGLARVSWKLGQEVGPQSLVAEASNTAGDPLNNSPLTLSAQAVQPQPAQIVLLTPPTETAQNGVPLEQQPVVQVLDAAGEPLGDIEVLAAVASGGATLSGTTSARSDQNGQAAFQDLALSGPQGAQTLRFTVAAPALEVTSGSIQLVAGTAASLTAVEPLSYQATVNSPVSPSPSVVARDAAGNPVAGVSVTFTPNRNASVSPQTATTNDQGIAQAGWTLGSTANVEYSLTARIEGSSIAAVRFTATAQPGAAGRLRVSVQPSSPTQSGTPFAQQPVIQVADQNGNPAPQAGIAVTATISSGPSGSLANATATTDAAGQARFSGLTLTGAVGSYTLSFSATGLTGVTSTPFAITAGGAAQLAFATRPSTAARSRAPLVIQPVLQIQDPSGNPIRQAGVTVTATVSNGSVTGETAVTDEGGRADFSGLTIIGIPGPKDLTFSAPNLQSVTARVTLPSVQTVSAMPTHPASAIVGTTIGGPVISWTFRDAATRPVADADFTFTVPSGGTAAPLTPVSDPNGVVQIGNWTLGPTAGYQYLELRLPDNRVFRDSILAVPGAATDLVKFSGDSQSAPINSELSLPLVVRAVDQYGNGVPNVAVQWSTCDGLAGDPVPPTDANGFSSTRQPTGSQPSGDQFFCTSASATIGGSVKVVEFHYQVTGGPSGPSEPGISGATTRHSGPPPVAPQRSRLRESH